MMLDWMRVFSWAERQEAYYECRRCGTTVDALTDECPSCGSSRIARYDVS